MRAVMRCAQALRREEDGQALLWGAGVVVLVVVLFYGAVDIGLLVLGKIQAQTAADGAALSAAALKASVHNTRSLAYRAQSGQVMLARQALIEATGLAVRELSQPGHKPAQFRECLGRARGHIKKVTMLREGVLEFNQWVTDAKVGPDAVERAASIGLKGNLGFLAVSDRGNQRLLTQGGALVENARTSHAVGGVVYGAEAMNRNGHAGKSLVRISPRLNVLGAGVFGIGSSQELEAEAAAGPLEAHTLWGALPALDAYGINWYTVRLLPIGTSGRAP